MMCRPTAFVNWARPAPADSKAFPAPAQRPASRQLRETRRLAVKRLFVADLDGADAAGADHGGLGAVAESKGVGAAAVGGARDAVAKFLILEGAIGLDLEQAFATGVAVGGVGADEAFLQARKLLRGGDE